MIEIDGGQKSGSGTILRDSVPFSILSREDLHIRNIRAKRSKPGLRPQHLKAIEACAEICGGSIKGASVGATDIVFRPGWRIKGAEYNWQIGTAGSTTMFAMAILPLAIFADGPSIYRISGGLFQDFAPPAFYFQKVLIPMLKRMGIKVELRIRRPGYVPRGGGEIELFVEPAGDKLKALKIREQGHITAIKGIALSSLLKDRKVSQRMAESCNETLASVDFQADIDLLYDEKGTPVYEYPSLQAGAALIVWAETDTGCIIASDMAGARGRTSEYIGEETAKRLLEDIGRGASVDRFLADQLIPYAAFAEGKSVYHIPQITDHVESRLWLIDKFFQVDIRLDGKKLEIESEAEFKSGRIGRGDERP